jgi:hypothetical protein
LYFLQVGELQVLVPCVLESFSATFSQHKPLHDLPESLEPGAVLVNIDNFCLELNCLDNGLLLPETFKALDNRSQLAGHQLLLHVYQLAELVRKRAWALRHSIKKLKSHAI